MWKQPELGQLIGNKGSVEEGTVDSGFLSCYSSATSSQLLSEEMTSEHSKTEFSKSISFAMTDSGVDLSMSEKFDQLSLFDPTKAQLGSKFDASSDDTDFGRMSAPTSEPNPVDHEAWKLFFTQNSEGDTLLHSAIVNGYLEAILSIIDSAPQPCLFDILNDEAHAALHLAVLTKQPRVVRKLVLAGADLSVRNYQGNTPLHLACISGDLESVMALTEPITSMEMSCSKGKIQNIGIPQNLEQRNYNGETCLHVAASAGNLALVRHLVSAGAELETQELLGGRTALHLALERNRVDVALYLVRECRPQLNATTYAGCTPYEIASYVDRDIASELLSRGALDFKETPGLAAAQA